MQDLRQSSSFAHFMEKIGWKTKEEKIGNTKCKIFIKELPILGLFIKICRPPHFPLQEINQLAKKYHPFAIQINYFPTKTLQLDLTDKEEKIFAQFKKDCRYGIKKAKKRQVIIKKSSNIKSFIKIWHENALRRGFWIPFDKEIRSIYNAFGKKANLLLAFHPDNLNHENNPIAGAIILIHDKIAYYFHAASTPEGRKLSAQYLVIWEAIKWAKRNNCQIFDFEGIYDERFPQKSWKGFSHFKKSFGGKEIEYPGNCTKFYNPILALFSSFLSLLFSLRNFLPVKN